MLAEHLIVEISTRSKNHLINPREELEMVDGGCPHLHHIKLQSEGDDMAVELLKLGHPQPCTVGTCQSKLRVLRAASVHYPVLRKLLENVYAARRCHNFVKIIDEALHAANFNGLCKLIGVNDYTELIDEDADFFLNIKIKIPKHSF